MVRRIRDELPWVTTSGMVGFLFVSLLLGGEGCGPGKCVNGIDTVYFQRGDNLPGQVSDQLKYARVVVGRHKVTLWSTDGRIVAVWRIVGRGLR